MRPTTSAERVDTIDILRGLALFGILAANIRAFCGPASAYFAPNLYWTGFPDKLAQAFIDTFVQGKFIAIFAFLFGVGFAVQFDRASIRGAKFRGTFAKRMFLLLLIGLVHGMLIWFGDILLVYALDGLLLMIWAKRKDKTVKIWAAIFLLLMPLLMTGFFIASQLSPPKPPPARAAAAGGGGGGLSRSEQITKDAAIYKDGSFLEITAQRASDAFKWNWRFMPFYHWNILGLFLIGLLAWRRGLFRPAPESLPRYRLWMWIGFAVGVTGNVLFSLYRWLVPGGQGPMDVPGYIFNILHAIATPFLSMGYVCLVILLCQSEARRAFLHRFGAVGRMALTNYLLQSLIGTTIFYGYGGGFLGDIGPAWLIPLTFVIYIAQMYASPWWLSRYRFGPVEWAWRRMTYGGPLPMKREAASIPQAALATAPPE